MILLCGATGRVGGAAALELTKSGTPFRVLVRSPEKLTFDDDSNIDIVTGDLENADDIGRALDGVTKALLVTANSERQLDIERRFSERASAAGVHHLVKVSSMEASANTTAVLRRIHYESEQYVKSLDVAWTIIQPTFFMQNMLVYSGSIANAGNFAMPLGNAKTALVDARDVGAVCAAVLRDGGHENQSYRLTGPDLMTFTEVAARMSVVLDKEISYIDQSAGEFRAALANFVPSEWYVDAVCGLFAEIAGGASESLSPAIEQILGREPRSLEQFTADFSAAFRP